MAREYLLPQDTDNTLYIDTDCSNMSLREVIGACKAKWPNASFYDISLRSEKIKITNCPSNIADWTDYSEYVVATCYRKFPDPVE